MTPKNDEAGKIPDQLMKAVSQPPAGQMVLVVGAGCSLEAPTSLPLAREISREAYKKLIADGTLEDGDCEQPDDLSLLADAVVDKTGGQKDLVDSFPQRGRFDDAQPNHGALVATALLRERILSCVLTLNFDLSMTTALGRSEGPEVPIIEGQHHAGRLASENLIYLHGSANSPEDQWILRASQLDSLWEEEPWQQIVGIRVLSAPIVVFAGLGSGSQVLLKSVEKVRSATEGGKVFQVDVTDFGESDFTKSLDINEENFIQLGWCDFMRQLGGRLVVKQVDALRAECEAFCDAHDFDKSPITDLCGRLSGRSLLGLGLLRARWLLRERDYMPLHDLHLPWLADLLLIIDTIEKRLGATATIFDSGMVRFEKDGRTLRRVIMATGRAARKWMAMEADVRTFLRLHWREDQEQPSMAIVQGVNGTRPDSAMPEEILPSREKTNIVDPFETGPPVYSTDELRLDPELIDKVFA